MVEGIPGPDFAGLKQYSLNIKAWGRLRCRVVPGPFCVLKMCCGDIVGIYLVNSAEKCDLTRGVVLFSDHMWCNCVPVHGNCGF